MQIHTTKKQAERLIELGADAATADMRFAKESKKNALLDCLRVIESSACINHN